MAKNTFGTWETELPAPIGKIIIVDDKEHGVQPAIAYKHTNPVNNHHFKAKKGDVYYSTIDNVLLKDVKGWMALPAKIKAEKTEPVKTEPVKTEPVKTEPVKTEPVKTEQTSN